MALSLVGVAGWSALSVNPAHAELKDVDLQESFGFDVTFSAKAPSVFIQRQDGDIDLEIAGGVLPPGFDLVVMSRNHADAGRDDSFTHVLSEPPYRISSERLDRLAPGATNLQVLVRQDNKAVRLIEFAVDVLPPEANAWDVHQFSAKFGAETPDAYEVGSGIDIPVQVTGLTSRDDVMVMAWHIDEAQKVKGFRHLLRGGDMTVLSQYLDQLPGGQVNLQLLTRRDERPVRLIQHRLEVVNQFAQAEGTSVLSGSYTGVADLSVPNTFPSNYSRSSGEDLYFHVGSLPNNAFVLVRAYHIDTNRHTQAFDYQVDQGPWRIPADRLDMLPNGETALQFIVRRNGQTLDILNQRITIQGAGNNNNPPSTPTSDLNVQIPSQQWTASYQRRSGRDLPFAVRGSIDSNVDVLVMAWDVDRRRKIDWFQHTLTPGSGWSIDSSRMDQLPDGRMTIQLLGRYDGEAIDLAQQTITMSTGATSDTPTGPWEAGFANNFPSTYVKGSGISLPLQMSGSAPSNGDVVMQAWHNNQSRGISEFTHTIDGSPWAISSGDLDRIPAGSITLQAITRVDRRTVKLEQRVINIQNAGSGGTSGSNGSGDNGSGGNNGGSTGGTTGGSDPDGRDDPDDLLVNGDAFLGMNLNFINFFNREWAFTDLMKESRPWMIHRNGSDDWSSDGDYPVDAQGWPLARTDMKPFTIMKREMEGHYPGGNYLITWDGSGDIVVGLDAQAVSSSSNSMEVNVTPTDNGIYLRVDSSSSSNPVRNIKVLTPEGRNGATFSALFLERLEPFKIIRFMDWGKTNNSDIVNWNERSTLNHCTMDHRAGAALEYMIELCNTLDSDMWVCMPHQANDAYVYNFAQMVKNNLDPDLRVYVEYSNEVWNGLFDQHHWINANRSGGRDFWQQWAYEMDKDFDVWMNVYGSESDRISRVLASQTMNPWVTNQLATHLNGEFDVVATNGYVDVPEERMYASITPDRIMDLMFEDLANRIGPKYIETGQVIEDWSNSTGREINWLIYEGGQHLTTYGALRPWLTTFHETQSHPRMFDLLQANMLAFEQAGGDTFVSYSFVTKPDNFGSWGHLEFQNEPIEDAVKYNAIVDYPDSGTRLSLTSYD